MCNKKRRTQSKKQTWPYIRFSERENSWMVDARTKDGGSRKFFGTKVEAQTYAQQCRIQKNNSGTASFANQELARYGWSVHRAIDFALDHLRHAAGLLRPRGFSVCHVISFQYLRSTGRQKSRTFVKYWEISAGRLSAAGWSLGWVSAIDSNGRTIWIVDALYVRSK